MSRFDTRRSDWLVVFALAWMMGLIAVPIAWAQEVVVQNDSVTDFGDVGIVGGFVTGEEGGAWLTSPCNGAIIEVQILWLAALPGVPHLGNNIWIREAGAFPVPGAVMQQLEGPVLQAGGLNLFRTVDEFGAELNVPVLENQTFSLTLEFGEATDPITGSVVRDIDGCQSGKNVLFATPGGWLDFCLVLAGDLVFRAVIDCTVPPGACCRSDGVCVDDVEPDACTDAGGEFQGSDSVCDDITCPEPLQACCFPPHDCLNLQSSICIGATGFPQGPGTRCDLIECFPAGACCLPDGSCLDGVTPEQCDQLAGSFQGNETTCAGVECPQPLGACCKSNGFCLEMIETDCDVIPNSRWPGPATDCEDVDQDGIADACMVTCGDPSQDVDGDCDVDLDDYDQFMGCISQPSEDAGPLCICADIDGDGDVDLHDYFEFANSFTGAGPGCP
ncbi:MAG: hypothetical protein V3W34_01680 [Phycisphaerae bacterium]